MSPLHLDRKPETPPQPGPSLRAKFSHFALLPLAFLRVVFGVTLRSQVAAEAHRCRARCDLREAGSDDNRVVIDGAGQTGCEGKRHRQSISHSDDDVANNVTRHEVAFDVGSLRHSWTG